MSLSIGAVPIGRETPRLVASVGVDDCVNVAKQAVADGADIVEIRVDHFPHLDDERGEREARDRVIDIRQTCEAPLLLTIRGRGEGGSYPADEARRAELYATLIPFAHAVDVEMKADTVRAAVAPLTRQHGERLILSYHNFDVTPTDAVLAHMIGRGFDLGADIVKLAVTPRAQARFWHP